MCEARRSADRICSSLVAHEKHPPKGVPCRTGRCMSWALRWQQRSGKSLLSTERAELHQHGHRADVSTRGRCAQAGQALAMLSQEQLAHVTSYSGLVAGAGPSLGPLGQVRALSQGTGTHARVIRTHVVQRAGRGRRALAGAPGAGARSECGEGVSEPDACRPSISGRCNVLVLDSLTHGFSPDVYLMKRHLHIGARPGQALVVSTDA